MRSRRILYASGLLAAGLYYVFDARYFSWIIWCALLLLPVLGLLPVLPFYARCCLSLRCARVQELQEACTAAAAVHAELPITPIKLYLRCENLFDGTVIKQKLYLRPGQEMPAEQALKGLRCGVVRCRVKRAGMLDLPGLFCLPVRVPAAQEFLLLPAAYPFPAQLAEEMGTVLLEGEAQTPSVHGMDREWRDVRPYREGDALRDIHWKLTARQAQVIVRESVPLADRTACFAVWWSGSREELEQVLKRLLGAAHYALDAGLPFTVLLCEGAPVAGLSAGNPYRIQSREDLDSILWEMLRRPPGEPVPVDWERFLAQEGVDADGVLLVQPDGILPAREVCAKGETR